MREGSGLPSGTVTFLFTDIERSTETVAALGDERYADVQDEHRKLLREAFAAHDGVEVGTEGDAFFVAFARAGDAVAAAIDGQRALADHPLRVRMGIHTGEAVVREGGYVGHDVHKAKRVSDAGHGGQILLSQATAELVRDAFDLTDLGPHRLKDLGEPQRLYQVYAEGLPSNFEPLRSLDTFRHNLPPQRSAFVGRGTEIAEIRKQLDMHRLVTLTGIGGCGKTRLALQVGAELVEHYPDGVFFVDLAPIPDPSVIARTAAAALGMSLGSGMGPATTQPTEDLLLDYLVRRQCLLIVDNCEHMLDDCAELVDRILVRCPDVTVIATSREALGVEGEQSWRVPSLSVPTSVNEAQASEAVSLFKTRAQEAEPDFELSPDNIAAVVNICRRLDGIPLAIELAAARVTHLSPRQIDDRLGDMFRLLTGGRRRVQRQQTLQGALDWSYELLDESERVLLRRLAVFSGGFVLEAAEGACSDDRVPAERVVDLLGSLVSKSLVDADRSGEDVRYRLLETVRLYADEKLREAAESDLFRTRHRDWFFAWVDSFSLEDAYFNNTIIAQFERELDNLRRALEWTAAEDRPDLVAGVAGRLFGLWSDKFEEGTRWLEIALAAPDRIDQDDRVACLAALYMSTILAATPRGGRNTYATEAVAAAEGRTTGPLVVAAIMVAFSHSVTAAITGRGEDAEEVRRLAAEAISLGEQLSERVWRSYALVFAAGSELDLGDLGAAERILDRLEGLLEPERYGWIAALAFECRAVCRYVAGDPHGAVSAARAALETFRMHDEIQRWIRYQAEAMIAVGLASTGDPVSAKRHMAEALRRAVDSGIPFVTNETLFFAAALALELEDPERASRLLAAGIRPGLIGAASGLRSPPGFVMYRHTLDRVRTALDADTRHRLRDEGRAMSLDDAVAYALQGLSDES